MDRVERNSDLNIYRIIISDGEILNSNFVDSNVSKLDTLMRTWNGTPTLVIISPAVQFLIKYYKGNRYCKLIIELESHMGLNEIKLRGFFSESKGEKHHSWIVGPKFPSFDWEDLQPTIITPNIG